MAAEGNDVRTYELTCTDCSFTTTFEGAIEGLFDVIEAHKEEMETSHGDHSVDFEAVSYSGGAAADD